MKGRVRPRLFKVWSTSSATDVFRSTGQPGNVVHARGIRAFSRGTRGNRTPDPGPVPKVSSSAEIRSRQTMVTLSGKWVAAAPSGGASASIFQWSTAWEGNCLAKVLNPVNYLVIILCRVIHAFDIYIEKILRRQNIEIISDYMLLKLDESKL